MPFLLLAIAWAQDTPLQLDDRVWLTDADSRFEADGITLDLGPGYLFRVDLDDAPAGVVFVGDGDVTFAVDATADRLRLLAHHLDEGGRLDDLLPLRDEGTWAQAVDTALLVGPGTVALLDGLEEVVQRDRAVGTVDDDGIFQVVVTGTRLGEARRRARQAVHERREALLDVQLDPVGAVRLERIEPAGRTLVDVHTPSSWAHTVPGGRSGPRTQWLTWVADPTGFVHDGYRTQVVSTALAGDPEGGRAARLAGRRHEGRTAGVHFERAVANVVFTPAANVDLDVDVTISLTLASDRPSVLLPLWLPNPPQEAPEGTLIHGDRFVIARVEQEGLPLERVDADGFGRAPGPDWVGAVYRLHRAVDPEEGGRVRVETHDRIGLYHQIDTGSMLHDYRLRQGERPCPLGVAVVCRGGAVACGCDDAPGAAPTVELGVATVPRRVLPHRPGQTARYAAQVRAGVQDKRLDVVMTGAAPLDRDRDRWWATDSTDDIVVAVGDWTTTALPGTATQPMIRLHTRGPADPDLARTLRGMVHFFDPAMPPFPQGRLALAQGIARVSMPPGNADLGAIARPRAEAYPGLVHLRPVEEFRLSMGNGTAGTLAAEYPHEVARDVAQAVAYQWWSGVDVALDDAWMREVMPRVFRDLYIEHVEKPKVTERWALRRAEQLATVTPGHRPLDDAPGDEARLEELAWLFTGLVRARVGEHDLLEGLHDALVEPGPLTTDRLRHHLEATSGDDLDDVFDLWLAGLRPTLDVRLAASPEGTHLTAVSDLPFGTFLLPVEVGGTMRFLEVVDGHAEHVLDAPPRRVRIDPEGWLPVRTRTRG